MYLNKGESVDRNLDAVKRYYGSRESRLGYWYLLKGTKHFGLYRAQDKPWQFAKTMRQMEDFLIEKLRARPGQQFLDAGCGMGRVAVHVASTTKAKVEGVDILGFNISEAKRFGASDPNVHFQIADYADLPFDNDSFDAVYTMETLVHASDPTKVLNEFSRVLKPGGRLINFEYSRSPDQELSHRAKETFEVISELGAMPSLLIFTHGTLEKLLQTSGFVDITKEDLTKQVQPMVRTFAQMARLPYAFVSLLGSRTAGINSLAAVEMWRYRKHINYVVYDSVKLG
jgi:sterol 24-C-methyltransferase